MDVVRELLDRRALDAVDRRALSGVGGREERPDLERDPLIAEPVR